MGKKYTDVSLFWPSMFLQCLPLAVPNWKPESDYGKGGRTDLVMGASSITSP